MECRTGLLLLSSGAERRRPGQRRRMSRLQALFTTWLLGCCLPVVAAPPLESNRQQVIQPQQPRRDIKIPRIDTEDFEIGIYGGVMSVEDFGTNSVYGLRAAYHITEDFFIEGAYGMTDTGLTSYERLSGGARLLTDSERQLRYYNISLGYNLLPGESFIGRNHAFNSSLYAIGGIGTTDFAGDKHFTINFGAGYRLLTTDWLALHADVRDHVFDIDIVGTDKTTHNIEIDAGFTIFF